MKTISFMRDGDNKGYFYRSHKECYDLAEPTEIQTIEGAVIDAKEMIQLPFYNN